jgi:hypothetical protein
MPRPARKILVSLITIVIGLAVALLVTEGLVRVFFDQPIMPRFVMDSGFGVRNNQPGITMRHYVPGEYSIELSSNSAGMRGEKEYRVEKPSGTYRIAMVGDSFVYGFGVTDEEVLSRRLEDLLHDRFGSDAVFEVLNFGVSGFGQAEELVVYRNKVRNYQPDEVILFYFNNDIGNNAVSKLFKLGEDGELTRTGNEYLPGVKAREIMYGIAPIRWLFNHSQAWNLVRNRLSAIVQRSLLEKQGMRRFDDATTESLELTRILIKEFIGEIIADGAVPTVFIIPHQTLDSNFPLASDEIQEAGAELVDGREFLLQEDYYRRDSHWRPSGHQKVAEKLAEAVSLRYPGKKQTQPMQ